MKHTISVLVENKFGVLARVAGMFSGRGFNIHSLNVAPTHDRSLSRITVVAVGDDPILEQINNQLQKQVNVNQVVDFKRGEAVERELLLVKLAADSENRSEVIQICDIFRAKIININRESVILEITGDEGKVRAFLDMIGKFEIVEISRTGKLALERSHQSAYEI
ncbi:MAG: acetolactate synthase small subunit [Opitutae bacterium]|nr:acetolactate synthase small subunit [Opitutae bacterium]